MKRLFMLALLLTGCVTTGSGPEPKFSLHECLKLNEASLKKVPPTWKEVYASMLFKVADVGTTYYVVEQYQQNQLVARNLVKFADAEKETEVVPCPKTRDPEEGDPAKVIAE